MGVHECTRHAKFNACCGTVQQALLLLSMFPILKFLSKQTPRPSGARPFRQSGTLQSGDLVCCSVVDYVPGTADTPWPVCSGWSLEAAL